MVHGSAAGVLEELPAPDAVFVGGSGGELEDIFKIILKKNPHVRIVITAVTLETVQEAVRLLEQNGFDTPQIVQIAVTEVKKRGQYHMPVSYTHLDVYKRQIDVSIYEYDEEGHMKVVREEGFQEGQASVLLPMIIKKSKRASQQN